MGKPMFSVELKGYSDIAKILNYDEVHKAARLALTRAVESGKAEAARQIYARWNIKKADINRAVGVTKAKLISGEGFEARIFSKGRPMSLTYFGAKWFRKRSVTIRHKTLLRNRGTGKSGVFVQILRGGKVTHLPHAWIGAVETKRADVHHIGVFTRESKERHPIVERRLITIASMFNQEAVREPTMTKIEKTWDNEFPRLLGLLFRR